MIKTATSYIHLSTLFFFTSLVLTLPPKTYFLHIVIQWQQLMSILIFYNGFQCHILWLNDQQMFYYIYFYHCLFGKKSRNKINKIPPIHKTCVWRFFGRRHKVLVYTVLFSNLVHHKIYTVRKWLSASGKAGIYIYILCNDYFHYNTHVHANSLSLWYTRLIFWGIVILLNAESDSQPMKKLVFILIYYAIITFSTIPLGK